jgi:cell wall-associated NlpC family hydrolase
MNAPRFRFGLVGPSTDLDARTHAMRGDLADSSLAGKLFAPHYADPMAMTCSLPFASLHDQPRGAQSSELLAGETFMLLDTSGGWAWGWCAHDHYVGYVQAEALAASTGVAPVVGAGDPIEIARSFLGMPYVWGGRGGAGIDCSGLVQRALAGIGVAAPRDSDMQGDALGIALDASEALTRGDLIFFTGHVGMMADNETLIHATRHHGKVVEEPLADVVARFAIKYDGVGIVTRRRIAQ